MDLFKQVTRVVFDTSLLEKGSCIYARHKSWFDGICGLLVNISEEELTVLYANSTGGNTNHFYIRPEDVKAGKWLIRWSEDLTNIEEIVEGRKNNEKERTCSINSWHER